VEHAVDGQLHWIRTRAICREVYCVAIPDLLIRDGYGLVRERGNDMKAFGIDERIRRVCCRPVK
jgi:hypothetical protein